MSREHLPMLLSPGSPLATRVSPDCVPLGSSCAGDRTRPRLWNCVTTAGSNPVTPSGAFNRRLNASNIALVSVQLMRICSYINKLVDSAHLHEDFDSALLLKRIDHRVYAMQGADERDAHSLGGFERYRLAIPSALRACPVQLPPLGVFAVGAVYERHAVSHAR